MTRNPSFYRAVSPFALVQTLLDSCAAHVLVGPSPRAVLILLILFDIPDDCAAGILDGLYVYLDSLEVSCWQHILTLMHQMLQSQQATSAGLSTTAVVGIGRLLMHSADACADLEWTEQLVALLVHSYVQPQASGVGEHLAGTNLTPT